MPWQVFADRDGTPFKLPLGITSEDGALPGKCNRTVLVTKVLLGNCTQEKIKKPPRDYKKLLQEGRSSPSMLGRQGTPGTPGSPVSSSSPARTRTPEPVALPDANKMRANHSDEYNSVYRCKPGDAKQKQWFVFDSAMILPEYLVEYENASIEGWAKYGAAGPDNSELLAQAEVKPETIAGMGPLAMPFENFVKDCAAIVLREDEIDPVMSVVNTAPMTAVRPKLHVIEPDALTRYFNGLLTNLVYLNLHNNNIRQLDHLSACPNLQKLVCSFNEIHKIEGLDSLKKLERLEIGFNFIKRIDGLQQLHNLKALELNNNLIYRLEDLGTLRKHNPNLTDVNFSSNAISDIKSYRSTVLSKLDLLQVLDGKPLSDIERSSANTADTKMSSELILQCSHFVRRSQWSHVNKSPLNVSQTQSTDAVRVLSDDWMANVEELDMDHRRLRKIAPLNKLTKLRRASFCDNEMTKIEGIDQCYALEELFLEENRILKIEKLSTLSNLRKLDLGRNKITKCDGLENLQMLAELSLEDNEIEELSHLAGLHSLMELYLCNNKVVNLSELLWLKELPKLIILDLFGNPCFSDPEYRYLPSLY